MPEAFQSFQVPESIPVRAIVTDESNLESIGVQLVRQGLIPVLSTINFQPEGNSFEVSRNYALDDLSLETGEYFLRIIASDGTNETSATIPVTITGVPLERKGVFLVSGTNGQEVAISMLENDRSITPFKTLPGDYQGCGVSSLDQYINVIGRFDNDFISMSAEDGAVQWTVPLEFNFPNPYFEHLGHYEDVSYVCFHGGEIRGYNFNKSIVFSANSDINYFPQKSFLHDNRLFVQEQLRIGTGRQLSTYLLNTGFQLAVQPIDFDIVDVISYRDDEVFVFANDNGQGKFFLFNINGTIFWEPRTLPAGAVLDAEPLRPGVFLIAHEDEVLIYDHENNSTLLTYQDEPGVVSLKRDALNNELFMARGNQVMVYDLGTDNLITTVSNSEPVDDLHVLYNK